MSYRPSLKKKDEETEQITVTDLPLDAETLQGYKPCVNIVTLEDNGSTTAGTWLAKTNKVSALVDGQLFLYKITVAGASTTTLNITGSAGALGAKTVYRVGTTKLTTHYAVGHYILLAYNSLNTCFRVVNDYDSNSDTYVRQYQHGKNAAGATNLYPILTRYNLTNKSGTYDNAYARFYTDTYIDMTNGYLYAPNIPKAITTQDVRITDLQDGTYVLTYHGKIRLYWNGTESDDYVEHLQSWSNTWNPILVVQTKYSSESGTSWFWQCYNFIGLGWNFKGKVTPEGNAYTDWRDCKYFVHYTYPNIQLGSKTKPVYLAPGTTGGYSSYDQAYKFAAAVVCDEFAGGTKVTLNGTDKGASEVLFYAPVWYGTPGQFLQASGENKAPVWADLATVATSGSYNDLTDTPTIPTATTVSNWGFTKNVGTVTSVSAGTGLSISGTSTINPTVNIASGYKLLTTAEYNALNAKQDAISVGTNGQLLSSNGSSLVWTNDNRGLLHHDLVKIIESTTTDKGWKMFNDSENDPINGFFLRSLRFQAQSPSWGVGDFGAGIVFGGGDTKGVVSVSYGNPKIKFAGGNDSGPRWWVGLTGTSATTYDLDELSAKQNKISALGTNVKPIYFSSDGAISACLNYAGGTKVTLNNTEHKGTSASFYAPTTAGTSGYSLKSNGSYSEPRWAYSRTVQVGASISSGAKNCASVTFLITNGATDHQLNKGLWYYSGTYGVFIVYLTTALTTPGGPRTEYISGYVSSSIPNNTTITLVEL